RRPLAVVMIALLAACASSPKTNFYTLSVMPASDQTPLAFPVQLAAVHLPPALDRREMVRLTSDNRVEISDTDRWSAALDEMVRNVLSQDLAARVPNGLVILPDAPAPHGTATLIVSVATFGRQATDDVQLNGSWTLLGNDKPMLARDFTILGGAA